MEFLSAASSSLVDFLPGSNKFTFEMAFEICKALEDDIKSKSVCTSTFDWNEISQTVNRKFKLTPIQCCQIWKYLAYGKWLEEENAAENSDDEEPYYQPYEAIIRYKINRPLGESSSECQSESNLAPKLINTNIPAKVPYCVDFGFYYFTYLFLRPSFLKICSMAFVCLHQILILILKI